MEVGVPRRGQVLGLASATLAFFTHDKGFFSQN